jgi:DNA-directed RNA polymerase specialized sigma24 family protein
VLFAKWLEEDGQMQEPENFLFRLAHHRMCNWWRHHTRTREELTDFVNPGRETAEAILEAGTEFTDRVVSKVDLAHALRCLPFRQHEVLALRFHDELTVGEAASDLRKSDEDRS